MQSNAAAPPPTMYCHCAGIDGVDAGRRRLLGEVRRQRVVVGPSADAGDEESEGGEQGGGSQHRRHIRVFSALA